MTRPPVMVYLKPHRCHRDMAEQIGADMVECEKGNPLERLAAATEHDFSDRTVIVEGGTPLFQVAAAKLLGNADRVILLAADETQSNIFHPLPYYEWYERMVHRACHRYVDAAMAVGDRITAETDILIDGPVESIYPYLTPDRYEQLGNLTPDLESNRVLFLGGHKYPNGIDVLHDAVPQVTHDIHVDVAGNKTDKWRDTDRITHHGYVTDDELTELFSQAACFLFPAHSGAYPVVTLEALRAGLPPITTDRIGTHAIIKRVHPELIRHDTPTDIARGLEWYFNQPSRRRYQFSDRAAAIGATYDPGTGRATFKRAYQQLTTHIDD